MADVSVPKTETTAGTGEDKVDLSKIFRGQEEVINYLLQQDDRALKLFAYLFEDFGNRLIDISDILNQQLNRRSAD